MKLAAAAAALLVGGCAHEPEPDPTICQAPATMAQADQMRGNVADGTLDAMVRQGEYVERCAHLWAYRLSPTPDAASEVATAVLGACREAIDGWDAKTAAFELRAFKGFRPQWRSPLNGEMGSSEKAHRDTVTLVATYRVAEARAGHCRAP